MMSLQEKLNNFYLHHISDVQFQLISLEEEVQTHDLDIVNLDETMTTLQSSMSDLEDTVDSVEDGMTGLEVENDEIGQRITVLEETVMGMTIVTYIRDQHKFKCL